MPGETPSHESVQQLVEAESGKGTQGINRTWLASISDKVVLLSDGNGIRISRDDGTTYPTHVVNDGTQAGGSLSGTYPNPGLSTAVMDLLCPPGTVIPYAGVAGIPTGWLSCDGSIQSVSSYPRLFAVLGGSYGGNGTTTFGLPNLVGRVVLGVSGAHPLTTSGGSETAPGPAHTHPGSHQHGMAGHVHNFDHNHTLSAHVHPMASHTHTLSGHLHQSNIDHDHANLAATAAASTNGFTGVHEGPSAAVNIDVTGHTHAVAVNLPALGTSNSTSTGPLNPSGLSSLDTSGVASPPNSSGPGTDQTSTLSGANTGAPSAPGLTATDSSAPAASFPGTIPTLPPFLTLLYLIRTGS